MCQRVFTYHNYVKNYENIKLNNKKITQTISGLTQDQTIAQLQLLGIEISKSTYAKIETNRMNIKISELVALCKIFHANISDFFEGLL